MISIHSIIADMAATMEMLNEYKTYNTQFCKRLFDFLSIAFVAQVSFFYLFSYLWLTRIVEDQNASRG
jgi:hypothetical protein